MNDITLSATNSSLILRKQPSASSLPVQASNGGKPQKAYLCNCKKTKCLKLYCECFAKSSLCTEFCVCQDCCNLENNNLARREAIQALLSRNPDAFNNNRDEVETHISATKKGCNCKKSHCKKKYCECWAAKILCNETCKCEGCKNGHPNEAGKDEAEELAKKNSRSHAEAESNEHNDSSDRIDYTACTQQKQVFSKIFKNTKPYEELNNKKFY